MIPCYLTNRDLLTPVQGMVEHLLKCEGVGEVVIVDCASTYEPLLAWYEQCPVRVIRAENLGPRAAWQYHEDKSEFYFVSDADLDLSSVPLDFLTVLRDGLKTYPDKIKTGLSLRLDDLPDTPMGRQAALDESKYWEQPFGSWYEAAIDTTAAMYRRGGGWIGYIPSLRAAPPYCARHLAWYLDRENLPEDWRHYFTHLDPVGIVYGARWQQAIKGNS